MIFYHVAELFYTLITGLLNGISIPQFSSSIFSYVNQFFTVLQNGAGLFAYFMPIDVIRICFPILLVIISSEYIYYFVMWILKKIPLVGIE